MFNFDLNSFVIEKSIDVIRAVLLEMIMAALELTSACVKLVAVEADLGKISVIINNTFSLSKFLYFLFHYSVLLFSDFKNFSKSCFSFLFF